MYLAETKMQEICQDKVAQRVGCRMAGMGPGQ